MADNRMVNPPHIITIHDNGFSVDLDGMEVGRMYVLEFDGGRYEIAKRDDGALAVYEVLRLRDMHRIVAVLSWRALSAAADRICAYR